MTFAISRNLKSAAKRRFSDSLLARKRELTVLFHSPNRFFNNRICKPPPGQRSHHKVFPPCGQLAAVPPFHQSGGGFQLRVSARFVRGVDLFQRSRDLLCVQPLLPQILRGSAAALAGDQQAALFGQGCFSKGEAKNTYGTGCFLLMNTGDTICRSRNGLISTIAISLNGRVEYALEGSVFVGGAVIQWVRDGLRMIQESRDAEYYAQKVPDNGGVYIVPAFTGLGAPYWDMYARGAILGITRGTTQNHIIRAAEESIAYQSADLMWAMEKDTDITISTLKVDGGASRDHFLMQFQSDILNKEVLRPAIRETTALGAAYLAGLATGVWKSREEISHLWSCNQLFEPKMDAAQREKLVRGWHKAVGRSQDWAEHEV